MKKEMLIFYLSRYHLQCCKVNFTHPFQGALPRSHIVKCTFLYNKVVCIFLAWFLVLHIFVFLQPVLFRTILSLNTVKIKIIHLGHIQRFISVILIPLNKYLPLPKIMGTTTSSYSSIKPILASCCIMLPQYGYGSGTTSFLFFKFCNCIMVQVANDSHVLPVSFVFYTIECL